MYRSQASEFSSSNTPNAANVITYNCWTKVLGEERTSYTVYVKAWASHTSGELQVYPDETMTLALARFPLGQLGNAIIVNENVLCLKTSNECCAFLCESKQQQMNWLRVLRFPLLSPLPVNESKGWQWDTLSRADNEPSDDEGGLMKKKSLVLDAKAQTDLQEMQERNRIKRKEREDRELKFEKKREHQRKQCLKNRQERLLREGREEELNWTKSTKNMYKTLGVDAPSSLNLTPSLLKQELSSTETPQDRAARASRERAEALRAAREQAHANVAAQSKAIARERREQRHKRRMQEELFEASTMSDLSLMSSHVQDMVDGTASVKYRHALVHSSRGEEQVKACVTIQKIWRGFMCRNVHRLLGKYFAAVMIQKAWLLHKFRRAMKKTLQKLLDNQRQLARYYREQKQFKKQDDREEAKVKKKVREKARLASCVTIQRGLRAWLAQRRRRQGKSQSPSRTAAHGHTNPSPERQFKNNASSDPAEHHPGDESSDHSDHDTKKHKKKKHKSKKDRRKKDKSREDKEKDKRDSIPDSQLDNSRAPSEMTSTTPPSSDVSGRPERPFSGHRPVSGHSRPITGQSLDSIHEEDSEHVERQPASSNFHQPVDSPHPLSSRPLSSSADKRKRHNPPPFALEGHAHQEPYMEVPCSESKLTTKSDFFGEDGMGMESPVHGLGPDNKPDQEGVSEGFGPTDSVIPNAKFKEAVEKVTTQRNIILNIFDIDESNPDYTDEVIDRQFTPDSSSLRAVRPTSPSPSSVKRGRSFRRLLSS